MDWNHKVAIVTGGSRGLGKDIATQLVNRGVKVVIADINEKVGNELVTKLNEQSERAVFIKCNITILEDLKKCFEYTLNKYKRLDIVVNNAGVMEPPQTDPLESKLKVLDVNLKGSLGGTALAIDYFKRQQVNGDKWFNIVNIASIAGAQPIPVIPFYSVSKLALLKFTQMHAGLRAQRIRVNAVCPYTIDTPMMDYSAQNPLFKDSIKLAPPPLKPEKVTKVVIQMIEEDRFAGDAIVIDDKGDNFLLPPFEFNPNIIGTKL